MGRENKQDEESKKKREERGENKGESKGDAQAHPDRQSPVSQTQSRIYRMKGKNSKAIHR